MWHRCPPRGAVGIDTPSPLCVAGFLPRPTDRHTRLSAVFRSASAVENFIGHLPLRRLPAPRRTRRATPFGKTSRPSRSRLRRGRARLSADPLTAGVWRPCSYRVPCHRMAGLMHRHDGIDGLDRGIPGPGSSRSTFMSVHGLKGSHDSPMHPPPISRLRLDLPCRPN